MPQRFIGFPELGEFSKFLFHLEKTPLNLVLNFLAFTFVVLQIRYTD